MIMIGCCCCCCCFCHFCTRNYSCCSHCWAATDRPRSQRRHRQSLSRPEPGRSDATARKARVRLATLVALLDEFASKTSRCHLLRTIEYITTRVDQQFGFCIAGQSAALNVVCRDAEFLPGLFEIHSVITPHRKAITKPMRNSVQ